ncbi:sperm axonemal maintenance protein CFAP97D1-like isoform X1 [Alosa sapidissima]|uniref:sperm axonemal maintenance protein CFAP97D1-like isoform X1 n=2 Tax=Alosa sapidissima TaxID=34773 RepID=UPI001C08E27D|nr:sperm axonemal maintenance protein CFAP97D1-like isoform X1 [Alosa sapidissima]
MNKADYLAFPAIVSTPGQYIHMRTMWDGHHYKYHMDRMRNVKPMVDNKAPRTYIHCHLKMKKIQMEQERLMEVERDNRLLVSRIARTMAKGGLDNWNQEYEMLTENSGTTDLRNRELVKISLENQAVLKKIKTTKPVYDHKHWLNDFKVTRDYMNRLRKYPHNNTTKVRPLELIN